MGIATLLQAQTIDLSATDSSLVVPSGFALLCERRGVGKHFCEDKALTRAFPWAGRMNAVYVGNTVEVQAGKRKRSQAWSPVLFHLNFGALLAIGNMTYCKSILILAGVK